MEAIDSICIPIMDNDDQVVEVHLDQLPDDSEEVLEVLRAEAAPLGLWLDFAKAYLQRDRVEQYVHILEEAVSPEASKFFEGRYGHERVQILCCLASYHVTMGVSEKDRGKKRDFFTEASRNLQAARQIDFEEQLPCLGLGVLALAKNETETAKREFTRATKLKSNGCTNVAGHLALAALHFNQGQYTEALQLYRKALREHPRCPPEVRLGIAASLFQMGNFNQAKLAFQRVLQLDPRCAEALLGLAVITFNDTDVHKAVNAGLDLVCRAYESDPGNQAVLHMLGHIFLLRGDFHTAGLFASKGYEAADSSRLQAECLALLGRSQHASGDFAAANRSYGVAARLDAKLPIPHLGLAQMFLQRREYMNAVSELENVLKAAPGCEDALHILGALYPLQQRKVEKTIDHFKQAVQQQGSSDPKVQEMYAEMLATSDPQKSLAAYQKAVQLWHERRASGGATSTASRGGTPGSTPAQLLNNAAVLHFQGGLHLEALELMQQAFEAASSDDGGISAASKVTMGFNLARMREASGHNKEAKEEYLAIISQFPSYIEPYLRLACICWKVGDIRQAVEWAERALQHEGGHQDALALMGVLHVERKEWPQAKLVLDKLVKSEGGQADCFGRLAKANLSLYTTPSDRHKPGQAEKVAQHFARALDLYQQVLDSDPGNIYAANGVGAVLAEQGHLNQALQVFSHIWESAASIGGFLQLPDVWVNLGSIHLAKQEYADAVKMYRMALTKFYHSRNAQVLLYLARAQYHMDQVPDARRSLLRAIHLAPTDHNLFFNVALCMQEQAVRTLRTEWALGDPRKLPALSNARDELLHATRFFQRLDKMGGRRTGIDPNKLATHLKFCNATVKKAAKYVEQATLEMEQLEARRREDEAKRQLAEQSRQLEDMYRQAAEQKEKKELERRAAEAQERLQRMKGAWAESERLQKAAEEGDAEAVAEARKKKKSAAAAKQAAAAAKQVPAADEGLDALFGEDSDDDDYDPTRPEPDEPEAGTAPAAAQEGPVDAAGGHAIEDELFDPLGDQEGEGMADATAEWQVGGGKRGRGDDDAADGLGAA